jgi:phage terminase large subunit
MGITFAANIAQWALIFGGGRSEDRENPFAALLIHVDGDGRCHVAAEEYQSKLMPDDHRNRIRGLAAIADADVEAVLIDPSEPQLIELVRQSGMNALGANNDVDSGIQRVRNRLGDPGDGRPRLTVSPSCENLIRELESYELKPDSDKPKKEFDHAPDALRYGVAYLDPPEHQFGIVHFGSTENVSAVSDFSEHGWTECR